MDYIGIEIVNVSCVIEKVKIEIIVRQDCRKIQENLFSYCNDGIMNCEVNIHRGLVGILFCIKRQRKYNKNISYIVFTVFTNSFVDPESGRRIKVESSGIEQPRRIGKCRAE